MYKIKILLTTAVFILSMFAIQAQTPGGVSNGNYTWAAWLTPDSYSNGTWTNLFTGTGAIGNFTGARVAPIKVNTGGYNFQPAVQFLTKLNGGPYAPNQLTSQLPINIAPSENVTTIFVLQRTTGNAYDFLIGFGSADNNLAMCWRTNNSDNLTFAWPGTTQVIPNVNQGIFTVDNSNSGTNLAGGTRVYLNGVMTSYNSTQWNGTNNAGNGSVALGGSTNTGTPGYGYRGNIQEVIIFKKSGNGNIDPVDLQKIHCYLAIKYGITLNNTNNYINSAGVAVWNRTTNNEYNNNIFGIGRDNASGLNQVQSRSQSDNTLTIFKGTLDTNNNNSSAALKDKDFLMLGSNGLSGNINYEYLANTAFANGSIPDKINYHFAAVYKAQVMTAGTAGGSQTVNMNVTSTSARYILVSPSATFPTASTRFYKINALTATNVLINDGEYVTMAGFQSTPGGSHSVSFGVWLTPDSYSNGVWTNLGDGTIGDFTQPANWSTKTPPAVVAGTNFQPAMQFRSANFSISRNRLQSKNGINLTTSDAFTFLIVYKATDAGFTNQNLLNWGGGSTYTGGNALSYVNSNSPVLSMGWPGTVHTLGSVPFGTTSLVTVDNNNTGANGIRHYLNGAQIATTTSASAAINNQIVLGASYWDLAGDGERGVNADIQEVIMLQRPKATYPFLADVNVGADLNKIQTYLALKYGITLNSNYMATNGTIVWDTTANTGYNQLILGVGRDDETGLYQKQSVSAAYNGTTIFLGDKLQTLNIQNAATLNDKEFLILGSNGLTTVSPTTIASGTQYANGKVESTNGLNFQSNLIYKAQLTNLDTMTINMQLRSDYLYVFVSADANFDPAHTNIYPVNSKKIATIGVGGKYKYIRFAGYDTGPGGVNTDLKLWLHADDESSLNLQSMSYSGETSGVLGSYPFPVTDGQVQSVQSWTDPLRQQTYSWPSANPGTNWRTPVFEPNNLMMNFKPSVRFWGSSNTYGSYLMNPNGIMPVGGSYPWNPNGHTAYFVIASAFSSSNNWIYQMGFGSTFNAIPSPGYGVQLVTAAPNAGNMVGRIRSIGQSGGDSGDLTNNPVNNLFNLGATAINGYYQLPPRTTDPNQNWSTVFFRFNGRSDTTLANHNPFNFGFNLSQPSYLGASFSNNRTVQGVISEAIIFSHALTDDEQRRVESYLAIKYGVTLRPSNTATHRFNYTLSNDRVFWAGDVDPSDPVYGKYATFYNNVAAVIRDDAAKMNSNQSHSTDAGSILHMGVAGKKLGSNYDVGELPNDLEIVAWGSNSEEGITTVATTPCAPFETIFNKKWLVHKQTRDDRPITMLVGAEDNSQNNLGSAVSAGVMAMYASLGAGNDVSMIVADSPEKLDPGNPAYGDFMAVVPMRYIDGEQQCSYTFTDSVVYVTFGYKPNTKGCYGAQFEGSKTYDWSAQWPRTNYKINGIGSRTLTKDSVELGDSIIVTTQVTYDNSVRAYAYYPRYTTYPKNALELQRYNGTQGVSKVTTVITFNTPVVPHFSISGLDSRVYQRDQVTITGSCPGGSAAPILMYASDAKKSTYTIQGNRAVVNKSYAVSSTDKNGTLNVSFQAGVTTLTIEWIVNSRIWPGALPQTIYISPITITSVLPPPVVNEDGLSFTKMAASEYITTCEPMEYTFRMGNVNGVDKYVNFEDVLPNKMKWVAESVSFDSINAFNPSIKFNEYGGTNKLTIDSLLIPCSSEIMFKATAVMDADAPTAVYANRAVMHYEQMINNMLQSQDAQTLDSLTVFNAAWAERKDTISLEATVAPPKYSENNTITVTLKINNPNMENITDVFLDLNWDAGFTYVDGSWNNAAGSAVVTEGRDSTTLVIAGVSDGTVGFVLPNGETEFTFKLLAPDKSDLEYGADEETGNPTTQVAPVDISYSFSTEMDDPCVAQSMSDLSGILQVMYKNGKAFIIVNKHVTTNVLK